MNDEERHQMIRERLMNTRYNQVSNKELTHLVLTAEDKVRVKRYDTKEKLPPVYTDKIEEDKDEDNYTSNLDSPNRSRAQYRVGLTHFSGKLLELILEFYGESTNMYLICKSVFHKIMHQKIDLHNDQREVLMTRLSDFKSELATLKARPSFTLSSSLRVEFESEACKEDLEKLISAVDSKELSPKDMVVIKLYFTFMGIELADDQDEFYDQLNGVLSR